MANENDCNAILVPDFKVEWRNTDLELMFLTIIDESTFRSIKEGGGAEFALFDVPVGAQESYEQFDSWRKVQVGQKKINYHDALYEVTQTVSPIAQNKWIECIGITTSEWGLSIIKKVATDDLVVVEVVWDPSPKAPETAKVLPSSTVSGATETTLGLGPTIDRQHIVLSYHRKPNSAFLLTLNLDSGYGAVAFLPAQKPPEPAPQPIPPPPPTQAEMRDAVGGVIGGNTFAAVQSCLDRGFPVNGLLDDVGNTPLHLATKRQNVQVIRLLLDRGDAPDSRISGAIRRFHLRKRGSLQIRKHSGF